MCGALYCAGAAPPGMLAQGSWRIVKVFTCAGFAAVRMLSAYVVSKTALYASIR